MPPTVPTLSPNPLRPILRPPPKHEPLGAREPIRHRARHLAEKARPSQEEIKPRIKQDKRDENQSAGDELDECAGIIALGRIDAAVAACVCPAKEDPGRDVDYCA